MTDDFKFVSSSTSLFMMDESMSNLTSASGDVSASSGYAQAPPPAKKKRSLPGNPDPDAEVIALSPKSLLATNKYVCEICHKGFQRDQNLQLHRRGHNLPWKLKQRANKEVRKKVYLCPETTCVHHDPSRALGDLSGIKKHFCRKHGEKKWKCEKCSKRYAVQSDWKAHSKICGTREYRCDCGTLFSRRDSFITHRAFCDALADESARAIATQLQQPGTSGSKSVSLHQLNAHGGHVLQAQPLKREAEYSHSFNQKPDYHNILPWFAGEAAAAPSSSQISLSSPLFSSNTLDPQPFGNHGQNPNPDDPTLSHFKTPTTFPHMSATALLQKAAQMGVTMSSSNKPSPSPASAVHRPHQVHMSQTNAGTTAGLGLSSCESGFVPSKAASGFMEPATAAPCSFLHDMMTSLSSGFDGSPSFGQAFIGMLNPKRPNNTNFQESNSTSSTPSKSADQSQLSRSGDSLTRDFLGLKAFSHSEFLNMVNLDHINSSSTREQQNQNQTPWH